MRYGLTACCIVLLGTGALQAADDPSVVTTSTLIRSMSDLAALTRFPGPGERVVQFSSYDRRSNLPGGPNWFGNSDGFGGESIPNFEGAVKAPGPDGTGEYLVCDVHQPGAIVRTWTAAMGGTLRVYLDGADAPTFDGPAADFLMHRATSLAKAAGIEPAGVRAFEQRYADYFPIPFARSCRIVWIGNINEVHFYHVQLRLYPAGTAVESFHDADGTSVRDAAATVATTFERKSAAAPHAAALTIAPGATQQMFALDGPAAITELVARIEGQRDPTEALRGTVLRIAFDDYQVPQIVVPLGDFFGASPGVVPYESLPMSVRDDGTMICRFVMPFAKRAIATLENRTAAPVNVALTAATAPYAWDERSMHFRVRWRADHDLTARGGNDAVDLPFLSAHGQGVYVGTAVYVMSPCPVPTAGGNWWGEGDEKIFVDGEARPSIFGTGSEDYFNYAWSESDLFQYPYFAQPICTGPETRGYITNNRWHILDAIPFDRSLSFWRELFSHSGTPHLSYVRVSYWYAKPGSYDDGGGLNDSDLRVPPLQPWTVRAAGGATGATIFEAETACDASDTALVVRNVAYSAGAAIRLKGPRGALRVRAAAAGKYQVVLTCASGPTKATFTAKIDAKPLRRDGETTFTLETPYRERLVNLWCEPVELAAGEHTIEFNDITGTSGVGVDFVWLKPAK